MLSIEDVKMHCKASMETIPIGTGEKELQNGKDFYKYFFANYKDLRKYFKGAENYSPDDVQNSERFEKQGQRILLAIHILVNIFDQISVFRAYARETVNRHRQFKMEPALWGAFFEVFKGFLDSRGGITNDQKQAWDQLGKVFNEECQKHLENLNLPHV